MENDVMTPEEYEILLALGGDSAQLQAALEAQQFQAQMLRGRGEIPQGGMAGNVYVAPSITQYAAAMANQKLAGDADKQMTADRGQLLGNQNQQNQMVMRAILNGNRTPQQGIPTQGQTMPGMGADPYSRFRTGGAT